jgi:hypothetical protein
MQPCTFVRKAAKNHAADRGCHAQRVDRRSDGNSSSAIGWKAVDACGNGRECDRGERDRLTERDRTPIAGGQELVLALVAALPHRSDSMDHMARRQPISSGDLGIAGRTAAERSALREQLRSGRTMDRAIDASAAKQRVVSGVDDGIDSQCRDVGNDDFEPRRAELARGLAQADAAALTGMPLSANSCCNSPAWNISRMMSQPPTNSPLT